MFKRKKSTPAPATQAAIWHPVLKATMKGRDFSYDGSARTLGHVRIFDFNGHNSSSHYFPTASELRAFGEDCIEFAKRCEGLRSFTETDVPVNPKP